MGTEGKCPKGPLSTCVLVAGATKLLSKPLLGNQGAAGRSPPPNPHAVLRIPGMSTWLSGPSVSGSKQPLGQSGVRWTRGPSPRKPTHIHPCSRRAPRLAPQILPVPLTSADAAASAAEPGSTPGRCDSRPHPRRGQDVRPVSLGRGGQAGQGSGFCSWLRTCQGAGQRTPLGQAARAKLQTGRSAGQPPKDPRTSTSLPLAYSQSPPPTPGGLCADAWDPTRAHPPQPETLTPQASKREETLPRCLGHGPHRAQATLLSPKPASSREPSLLLSARPSPSPQSQDQGAHLSPLPETHPPSPHPRSL